MGGIAMDPLPLLRVVGMSLVVAHVCVCVCLCVSVCVCAATFVYFVGKQWFWSQKTYKSDDGSN